MTSPTTPDELLDARVALPAHVVHRSFAAETVVLNLRTGKYHGLNRTAGEIIDGFEQGRTPREVAATIAQEYGRDVEGVQADVLELLSGLRQRGLIEIAVAGEHGE
jgi:Coenzyme PQQ synthesis protein D (PqqD)